MASTNSSSRKRNQKSKTGSHHKNAQADNQNPKLQDHAVQQQWQSQNTKPQKHTHDNKIQQIQTQQQQQQQPQYQSRSTTFSKSVAQSANSETSTLVTSAKSKSGSVDCYSNKRKHNNKSSSEGKITLHTAIFWRRLDLVESLLQNASNPSETDQQGNTALMVACKVGDLAIISKLCDVAGSKLDIQHINKDGDTALHLCALAGYEDVCRVLITGNAAIHTKNKLGDTPLHLASKADQVSICNLLLSSTMTSKNDSSDTHSLILDENSSRQTAVCVSIQHQHTQVTRMLLDMLTPQQQANYLANRLQTALDETQNVCYNDLGSSVPGGQEVFLHGLLVSLSVLLICLAEKYRQGNLTPLNKTSASRLDYCLTNTDIIHTIVRIASNRYANKQIVPISCFLIIYLMNGVPEQKSPNSEGKITSEVSSSAEKEHVAKKITQTGRKFVEQFLNCSAPNNLVLKINSLELSDPSGATIAIALALTVVSLVRSETGRSWLEANRSHLTFLKEILLRNRSVLSLLTTACPLLEISYLESVCRDFVRLVDILDAKDREQNLAELLWEEERDRKRRERKKEKQQLKKQNASKEAKNKDTTVFQLQITELSSDDEMCDSITDNLTERRSDEILEDTAMMEIEHDGTNCLKNSQLNDVNCKNIACNFLENDDFSDGCGNKSVKKSPEFPSISNDIARESTKNKKAGIENHDRAIDEKYKVKEAGAVATMMRWADVAKLGCSVVSDKGTYSSDDHRMAQSKTSSNKFGSCDWPLSNSMKNESLNIENISLPNVPEFEETDRNNFHNICYDMSNQCCNVDTNSDDETSSSSSSFVDSHPVIMSNSILHISNNVKSISENKTNNDVIVGSNIVAPINTNTRNLSATNNCPSLRGRRKRRKSKQYMKNDVQQQEKSVTPSWSPLSDKSIVYMSIDANFESNSNGTNRAPTKSLPVVADPLVLRNRHDDNLKSSWLNMDQISSSSNSKDDEKSRDMSTTLIKPNSKSRREITTQIGALKTEMPAVLPPLKIRESNPYRTGVCGGGGGGGIGAKDSKIELPCEDGIRKGHEKGVVATQTSSTKQPFYSKITPLTGIKTGASLSHTNIENDGNVSSTSVLSSCQNNILPGSNLSAAAFASSTSMGHTLFNALPVSGQYTAPPPGFQAIRNSVSAKNVGGILGHDKNIRNSKRHNNTHIDDRTIVSSSVSKTGRVISTVLLDKVKNPPLSLQQQKQIPLLSTLAWNCGQESKLSWSKLLQSKPTSSVDSVLDKTSMQALFSTSEQHVLDSLLVSANPDTVKVSPHNKLQATDSSGSISQSLPFSGNIFQTNSTFSSILMNRMQSRSHNRDSFGNMDTTCRTVSSTISQSTFSVPDLMISSMRDTATSSLSDYSNITSNEYNPGNPNSNHHSTFSQTHRKEQYMTKTCVSVQNQSIDLKDRVEGLASNTRHDPNSKEGKGTLTLNSQHQGSQRRQYYNISGSRSSSPPVFFPEQIRDPTGTPTVSGANFPAFHEVHTSDFLSEMFSDPLVTDNIAINQIRQKILWSQSTQHNPSTDHFLQTSDGNDVDLDYYASLYQMKFRDVLGNLPGQQNLSHIRQNKLLGNQGQSNQNLFGASSIPTNYNDSMHPPRRHSLRWHRSLQKILDLTWTTRRQYGNIILPHPVPEYSIGMAGKILIVIGFLMNGTEVTVLIVDKAFVQIAPRMVEIMCNPEMDKYFLTRCKSFSESSNVQYIAMDLYEYNLCEYLQVCLTTCNQNTTGDVYTGLVWQLLQALGFLHHKLGVPHGCLAPCWIFINADGHLRLAGFGITTPTTHSVDGSKQDGYSNTIDAHAYEYRTSCWGPNDDNNSFSNTMVKERIAPSFFYDVRAAGKLAYFILTKGQHLFGSVEPEVNLIRDHLSAEAFDFISPMLTSDIKAQPTVDQCLKHPIFWLSDKKFRLILIVGSDVLTEMKTGIALTGTGAPTMMEILSLIDINMVSPNWIHEVDSTVLKEMRSFRVYKNNLAELTLFVYNCCLHFDKLSTCAKEVLDDPCKYFQNVFPSLFIAIYRSLKSSDRIDRTCYKPFF